MTLKQEIASSGYGKIWQSRRYRKAVLNGLQNVGKKPWMPKNDRTGISWTDVTWNTHNGCQKISEGCRFCYADSATGPKSRQGFGINGKLAGVTVAYEESDSYEDPTIWGNYKIGLGGGASVRIELANDGTDTMGVGILRMDF